MKEGRGKKGERREERREGRELLKKGLGDFETESAKARHSKKNKRVKFIVRMKNVCLLSS